MKKLYRKDGLLIKIYKKDGFLKKFLMFLYKIGGYIMTQFWKIGNYKKGRKYMFLPFGIGDILFIICYKDYFYDENTYFIINANQKSILKMYDIPDSNIIVISEFWKLMLIGRCMASNFQNEDIIYAHHHRRILPCKKLNENILGYKGITLLDLNKLVLGITPNAAIKKPKNILDKNTKNKILEEYKFKKQKKNILLCPYATSSMPIDSSIWENLVNDYRKKGYNVYTNTRDKTEAPLDGTVALSLKLDHLYGIIDQFEGVYSLRSGLCDLLAFSDVNLTVYYPSIDDDPIYLFHNFKNIGINDNIKEIICE
ncbi:MAG: hypothetical protein J6D28_04850 [Bacilli bacterium]|nr:hypothetical protein [Bacilli bacterium]